jgi:GTPase
MPEKLKKKRVILVNLVSPFISHHEADMDLEELKSLVDTWGGATIVRIIQRKMKPDGGTYIGSGKVQEIAQIVKEEKIDVVVINAIVQPGQLFNIRNILWPSNNDIQVWDRIDLILNIFDKHAHNAESKMQIELAKMRHMGPRIFGMGMIMSRQGGGIGTRGLGETNTELMKRHWRDAMKQVKDKLAKLAKDRERQMLRRKEQGFETISIVGYTNAGKTTLFNKLTGKKKLAEDVLFATLDSTVGEIYFPSERKQILVSDTIGFIQKLPPQLIDAFKSTLMESIHADMLVHVVDVSDHLMNEKIDVVEEVLRSLKLEDKEQILVFNKIDNGFAFKKEELEEHYKMYNPHFVSAVTGEGMKDLLRMIEKRFSRVR